MTWPLLWAGFFAFLLLPGPFRSVFSGVPLSSKATALFVMSLGAVLAMITIRPARTPRPFWVVLVWVAAVAKLALSPMLITSGWNGQYATAQSLGPGTFEPLRTVRFTSATGPRPHRVDRSLQFAGTAWGLDFMNDWRRVRVAAASPRQVQQPIRVLWTGWSDSDTAQVRNVTISAAGLVIMRVSGREIWRGRDPQHTNVRVHIEPGVRHLQVLYDKPSGVAPHIEIDGAPPVTTTAADANARSASLLAARGIAILGVIALFAMAGAFINAYVPFHATMARFDIGSAAALFFAAVLLILAIRTSIPMRQATYELKVGDDFLSYESMARAVLRGDLLYLRGHEPGKGLAYYHYPLYGYALAAAHYVFGDDFATVPLLNYLCLAALGVLVAAFLRPYMPPSRVAIAIIGALVFILAYHLHYARMALSDNLYMVLLFGALLMSVKTLQQRRRWQFFTTGALVAIASATRPSAFIYLGALGVALLMFRDLGAIRARLTAVASMFAGFALAVAPFTLRNRYVTGDWVMLVGGYNSITHFLYPPEGGWQKIKLLVNGRMPDMLQTLDQIRTVVSEHPLGVVWVTIRKILFTFGWTGFGPHSRDAPFLGAYFILFLLALALRRIPRVVVRVLLPFLVSHLASMVLAAPWTYGFKTILPFHFACLIGAAFLLKPRAHVADASAAVHWKANPEIERAPAAGLT